MVPRDATRCHVTKSPQPLAMFSRFKFASYPLSHTTSSHWAEHCPDSNAYQAESLAIFANGVLLDVLYLLALPHNHR